MGKKKKNKHRSQVSVYRTTLINISKELTQDNVNQLKFLCKDKIPAGTREKIKEPYEFVEELEKQQLLGRHKLDFLCELLVLIKRQDVSILLDKLKTADTCGVTDTGGNASMVKMSTEETSSSSPKLLQPMEKAVSTGRPNLDVGITEQGAYGIGKTSNTVQPHVCDSSFTAGSTITDQTKKLTEKPFSALMSTPSHQTNKEKAVCTGSLDHIQQNKGAYCIDNISNTTQQDTDVPGGSSHSTVPHQRNDLVETAYAFPSLPNMSQRAQSSTQTAYAFPSLPNTSQRAQSPVNVNDKMAESLEQSSTQAGMPGRFRIVVICDRWMDGKISLLNKHICGTLARCFHQLACVVQEMSIQDKEDANKNGVLLMCAQDKAGVPKGDPSLLMLYKEFPFAPDLIIGYQCLTGFAAIHHAKELKCLSIVLLYNSRQEVSLKEDPDLKSHIQLGTEVDFLFALGPALKEEWSAILNKEVCSFIPGLPDVKTRSPIVTPLRRVLFVGEVEYVDSRGLNFAIAALDQVQDTETTYFVIRGASQENIKKFQKDVTKHRNNKNIEVEVKSCKYSEELLNVDIRGVILVLLPNPSDGFNLVALNSIAAGVPVLMNAKSGVARVIMERLDKRFHILSLPSIDEQEFDEAATSETSILVPWATVINDVLHNRQKYFSLIDDLRKQWNQTFTWESEVEAFMNWLLSVGNLPCMSPSIFSNTQPVSTSSSNSEQAKHFVSKHLQISTTKPKYVLVISPEKKQQNSFMGYLSCIRWLSVFDFDIDSAKDGFLSSCEAEFQKRGVPACRLIPPAKDEDWKRNFTLPSGIPWILLEGLPELPRNITDNLDWLMEVFSAIRKSTSSPITFLVLWRGSAECSRLTRKLNKVLTLALGSSLKSLIELVMVNTNADEVEGDARLHDIAEDCEVAIHKINLEDICNAIACLPRTRDWKDELSFAIPVDGSEEPKILPPLSRWINSALNVLYFNIGDTPDEQQGDNAKHFYRGGTISWYALKMGFAIKRHLADSLRKKIAEFLKYAGTYRLRLNHRRGAGGTTSARMLLLYFHERFPCVCLKAISSEVIPAVKFLHEFSNLPVLILADCKQINVEEFDLDQMYNSLAHEHIPCVILEVAHHNPSVPTRYSTRQDDSERDPPLTLAETLEPTEADRFVEVYSEQVPERSGLLKRHRQYESLPTQIPFYYALVAFEDQFKGLEPFVKECVQNLRDKQQRILTFIALAHHYAQLPLPASSFAGILEVRCCVAENLEDFLTPTSIQLLLEEDGEWRTRHDIIAKEMIKQLLTAPLGIHHDNWTKHLASKVIEFVEYMDEKVINEMIITRIEKDFITQKSFSALITDVFDNEDAIHIFEKAISKFPQNPFFKVHLGRFYSIVMRAPGFESALGYTLQGINAAEGFNRVCRGQFAQMCGMVFTRQVRYMIQSDAELQSVINYAQGGVEWFRNAVAICPDGVDGYIPEVRLMCEVFQYVNKLTKFQGGLFSYLQRPDANTFLRNGLLEVSDVLENVPDNEEYLYWRRRLFILGRTKTPEEQLEYFDNLRKSGRVSIASVNRQISHIQINLCTTNKKSLWQIAPELMKCLEEALKLDDGKLELTMRLWVRVAPYVPTSLPDAENRIDEWCTRTKSLRALFYKHVITCIQILRGDGQMYIEDRKTIVNDMNSAVSSIKRNNIGLCTKPDRPVLWLGNGDGMEQLVTIEENIPIRKRRYISPNERLRKLVGILTKSSGKVGTISANGGLEVSYRGDLCFPEPLVGPGNLNKKVEFYLTFNYFGCDAFNVALIEEDGVL